MSLLGLGTIPYTCDRNKQNTSLRSKVFQTIHELRIIAKMSGIHWGLTFICCFDDVQMCWSMFKDITHNND